jgi:hypothetical protein
MLGEKRNSTRSAGAAVYVNGRQKNQYKECGGSGICEHGRRKTMQGCGGSGICEHGRRGINTRSAGGSSLYRTWQAEEQIQKKINEGVAVYVSMAETRIQECKRSVEAAIYVQHSRQKIVKQGGSRNSSCMSTAGRKSSCKSAEAVIYVWYGRRKELYKGAGSSLCLSMAGRKRTIWSAGSSFMSMNRRATRSAEGSWYM